MPSITVTSSYLYDTPPQANTPEWVYRVFTDKIPNDRQQEKLDQLSQAARYLAQAILDNVPACADRSTAMRKLREALHSARDAVVLRALV